MKKQYKAVFSAAAIAAATVITACACLLSVRGITAPASLLTLPAVTASDLFPSYAERCGLWFDSAINPDVTFDFVKSEVSEETSQNIRDAAGNIAESVLQPTLEALGLSMDGFSLSDYTELLVMRSKSAGTGFKLLHCHCHAFTKLKGAYWEFGISLMLDYNTLQPYVITLDDPYKKITDYSSVIRHSLAAFANALGDEQARLSDHRDIPEVLNQKADFRLPVCAGVVTPKHYSLLACKSIYLENRTVYLLVYSNKPVSSISLCALSPEQMKLL